MYVRAVINSQDRIRFTRGAALAAQLNHPNIVRQISSGIHRSTHYIVCELCAGGNIYELMQRLRHPLSVKTATHIILQVLDALDYAHNAKLTRADGIVKTGLVHRDISPSNILLADNSAEPLVQISDFGISRLYEDSGLMTTDYQMYDITGLGTARHLPDPTGTRDLAGTPNFTSAAQIRHFRDAKPEVDVWAAAATYYFMLTGVPPKDLSYGDKWELALIEKAVPILERNPELPAKLAAVIDAALVEEPEVGCKSAEELKRRIEAAL
jgi:serine/threonine-protein kinase